MSKSKVEKVLVTGAEGALGRFLVCDLVRRGYDVVGSCFTESAVADMQQHENSALGYVATDLGDPEAVKNLSEVTREKFGGVDAVVHAAGGFRYTAIEKASAKEFDFLVNANWKSALLVSQYFLPQMREQNFGRLVFMSSRTADDAGAGMGLYAGSKLALNALIVSLAKELKDTGITINAVAPTIIDTPANREAMPDADTSKWVTRRHIMECVEHFLSQDGAGVSGAIWGLGFAG